jgi:hypothetical protein
MQLYTKCPYCKKETSFRSFTSDRGNLLKEKGETIEINCKHCNTNLKVKIDNIYAKNSKLSIIIALSIIILGAPLIFIGINSFLKDTNYFVISFAMILIPSTIYQIINKQDRARVKGFNEFKVRK